MKILNKEFGLEWENSIGKGEIVSYEQFLLFIEIFHHWSFSEVAKGVFIEEYINPAPIADAL